MKDKEALGRVYDLVEEHGFTITVDEPDRVYGASVMLSESDVTKFAALYFPDVELPSEADRPPMSPKYLLVDAGMRLSWQYHHRRWERWSVLEGPVGIERSVTDDEPQPEAFAVGDRVDITENMRHRLVGLGGTGVLAEIWYHVDPNNPSDESDIVRISDDFGRPSYTPPMG